MVSAEEIAAVLNVPGTVAVMPTDTVYGLVARASDEAAVSNLYGLKDRHAKPGTLIGGSIDQLSDLGLTRRYLKAVEQYWPGEVSVIIPCSNPELHYLTQGLDSLAVRIPDDPLVQAVLSLSGPLMTSSANLPAQPPAETIEQAKSYFGSRVEYYFDGGSLKGREPSTVIRVLDDAIEVVRQGAVKIQGT